MLTPRSSRIMALPLLLLLPSACGKWAHSKRDQAIVTVPSPGYYKVPDDVFSLSGKKPDITYRTTFLIINEKASPKLLADVVNASVFSREAFADARDFEITHDYKNLYGDSGLEVQALKFMKKDLSSFEIESYAKTPISIEQKTQNARAWIGSEIAALNLSPEAKESFDQAWGAYCEAKIVEFASNSGFAVSTYKALPSPQPFCADYYETHGFLSGAACSNPANGNYFSCLWQEGVLKTRWFQPKPALPADASPEDAAALTAFNTEMAAKREVLTKLLNPDPSGFQAVLALNPEKVAIQADPIRNKITPNFFVSMFTRQLVKQAGNNVAWCSIATFGIKDPLLKPVCTLFGQAPLPQSPADWIDSMEGRRQGSSLVSLPRPSAPRTATTQQILQYAGERDKGKNSESDRIFHLVQSSPKTLDLPTYDGAGPEFVAVLDEIRSLLAPVIYGTFAPQDGPERELRLKNIAYREQTIAANRAQMKVLQDRTDLSINEGLKATNAGSLADGTNVAHGFIEIRFHFKQLGQILLGEFWPKDSEVSNKPTHVFRACFDVSRTESIDCDPSLPGVDANLVAFPAKLFKDPDTGRIDLSMLVTDPEAMALVHKPRVDTSDGSLPNYFMDFEADEFRNRTLRFELYSNRLRNNLDILTGKAFLDDGSKNLYEGGISGWELWDF